jgi:hypothetical protein
MQSSKYSLLSRLATAHSITSYPIIHLKVASLDERQQIESTYRCGVPVVHLTAPGLGLARLKATSVQYSKFANKLRYLHHVLAFTPCYE